MGLESWMFNVGLESWMFNVGLGSCMFNMGLESWMFNVGLESWMLNMGLGSWMFNAFQQYFSYIVVVSFISGGNQSTRRKPPKNINLSDLTSEGIFCLVSPV